MLARRAIPSKISLSPECAGEDFAAERTFPSPIGAWATLR
jgi:hypothetical protein